MSSRQARVPAMSGTFFRHDERLDEYTRGIDAEKHIHKCGAPDIWWGLELVEIKRGADNLSFAQRRWHDNYHARTQIWPLVVHYDGHRDHFRVFKNYKLFDKWRSREIQFPVQKRPALNAMLIAEYGAASLDNTKHWYEDSIKPAHVIELMNW